jgi:hypothetical protein
MMITSSTGTAALMIAIRFCCGVRSLVGMAGDGKTAAGSMTAGSRSSGVSGSTGVASTICSASVGGASSGPSASPGSSVLSISSSAMGKR